MASNRPSTPPPTAGSSSMGTLPKSPLTPEQVRRIVGTCRTTCTHTLIHCLQETNRLKAKALRDQSEAQAQKAAQQPNLQRSSSGSLAGQKRPYASISTSNVPATARDGRNTEAAEGAGGSRRPHQDIQPAQKFTKYVEYDFSKMTDTKGGFLTAEDDPHNKALHASAPEEKPAHMTLQEWERHQLLRSLRNQKAGPFEPGISVLKKEQNKACRECGSLEIDWKWDEVFACQVCGGCKEKFPDKYSLLTKTEAKEDYLLTDRTSSQSSLSCSDETD